VYVYRHAVGEYNSVSMAYIMIKASSSQPSQVSPLLSSAAALVRRFPKYFADVVVSVARKTDAQVRASEGRGGVYLGCSSKTEAP
jgi:hypothetical protein